MRTYLAQATRDRILDQIIADQDLLATETYREATRASSQDAERVIRKLKGVLNASEELSPEDQKFLEDFRAGLSAERLPERIPGTENEEDKGAESSFDQLDTPHASMPKQLLALACYMPFAILVLNLLGAVTLLITGSVSYFINIWLGFLVSLLLAGPMFLVFPGVLRHLVVKRFGLSSFLRSPGFGWEIFLGFALVIGGILGTILSERLIWAARAEVVELSGPSDLPTADVDEAMIIRLESSRVPPRPLGLWTRVRRDRQGGTSRSEYRVKRLLPPDDSGRSSPSDLCWWVGHAEDAFNMMQHPTLELSAESPYFALNPAHHSEYEKAVANALDGIPVPDCVLVLERVPPLPEIRRGLKTKLRHLILAVNAAPWFLLVVWGGLWIYRRIRKTSTKE